MILFNRTEKFVSGSGTVLLGSSVPSTSYRHMAIGFVAANNAKGTIQLDISGSLDLDDFNGNEPTFCKMKSINVTNGGHVHVFYKENIH
jgi:hypothetical protein